MDISITKSIAYDRARIPDQLARPPLRLPRNQTAAMALIQQFASRGHGYWTRGITPADRLPCLVSKFDSRFGILDPARTRTRKRAKQQVTAQMVVYRQLNTDRWLWFLLLAGRQPQIDKLADQYNEPFLRIADRQTPLTWASDYELRRGPRGSLTWWLTRKADADVAAELRYLASAHGRKGGDRTDDLLRAVDRARNRPMFAGVRRQVQKSLARSVHAWRKTHAANAAYPADNSRLPWFARSVRIYDDPPGVVLAAL